MDTEGTYKKSKGNAGLEGVHFQLNLLTVCLLNVLRNFNHWKISTENQEAGKYNDIVVELFNGNAVLIQAKHKENKKVTKELLLSHNSKNADFSLPKYFFSYEEIKNKFKGKTVIICTNTHIDLKGLKNILDSQFVDSDSVLHYAGGDGCSFFTCNENILPELKVNAEIYYNNNLQDKGVDKAVLTEENLMDFLKNLQIFSNYPCGNELEKIIEQLLSRLNSKIYRKISPQEIYTKVEEWFLQPLGEYLTEGSARAMFSEIKSDKYCESLKNYNVFFECNDFNFKQSERLFHVTMKDGYLMQMLKIHQALQDDKSKKLFVNPDDDDEVQKQLIDAFEQLSYTFLVMAATNTIKETIIKDISVKLRAILEKSQDKKVILVAESNNDLVQTVGLKDIFQFDGSIMFEHLSKETQERLLKNKNIVFQSETITLKELLETQTMENYTFINSEILEKLVKREEVKVGLRISEFDKDLASYYIHRTFENTVNKTKTRHTFSEENIFDINQKVILIVDGPGTGKTTVLTRLATIIKKNRPYSWVIRVNLNDYTKILKDQLNKNQESISVIDMLSSQKATELTNNFEKLVFSLNKKVVLILDGVDEISPDYKGLIFNLISYCQHASNFEKILVTTRPHLAQELETNLKISSFKILPFTKQNQIDFLLKYWTHNLQLNTNKNKDRCEQYAKSLIDKISSWIKLYRYRENHIAIIPLQVRMLAEIFQENLKWKESMNWEGCKEYLDGDKKEPRLPEDFDVSKLYDAFIEKKRNIFLEKENPNEITTTNEALIAQFNECLIKHYSVALEVMLKEKEAGLFSKCHNGDKDMKQCMLKIGIVQMSQDKIQFIHRTFAEYFVAASVLRELQLRNPNTEFQKFVIDRILWSVEFTVIRIFLDNSLHNVVKSLPPNIFKNYQSITYMQYFLYDKNLIFTLAGEGCVAILQLILKSINFEIIKEKTIDLPDNKHKYERINTLNDLQSLTRVAGVNIRSKNGDTPLHMAARKGRLEMVKFLVEQGADVNIADIVGWTALHWAARRGRVNTVKYLLECGTDIKVQQIHGFTALHLAAWCERYDTVKLLVESGVDVNIKDANGRTALHFAAEKGTVDTIEYLGECFMNVNVTDDGGYTALHIAALYKQWNCIKYLIEAGVDVNVQDKTNRTVLHYAAAEDAVDIIKYLVECGVDVNVRDNKGQTAVHAAAWSGYLDSVKCLMIAGVDVNIKDESGCTILHFAVEKGNTDTVKYLLECDVDVNAKECNGCTPLHAAVWGGYFDTMKCLVEAGADFNIENENSLTALHFAAEKDDIRAVRYLVKCGADVNIKSSKSSTPLLVASWHGYLDTVKCLVEAGANINDKNENGYTVLHFAAEKGNTGIVKYLVKLGINVNVTDKDSCTPLHVAAWSGYLDTVKCLVDAGADINIKNVNGYTVLHFATKKGNTGAVKYLVKCGVGVNVTDNNNCTALHAAAWGGYLDTVKCLVKLGVDVTVKSNRGNTALHLATRNNHVDTVKYLTDHENSQTEKTCAL